MLVSFAEWYFELHWAMKNYPWSAKNIFIAAIQLITDILQSVGASFSASDIPKPGILYFGALHLFSARIKISINILMLRTCFKPQSGETSLPAGRYL